MATYRYTRNEIAGIITTEFIKPILTANGYGSIPVIRSHQDAPAPSGQYIVVPYSGDYKPVGSNRGYDTNMLTDDDGTTYYRLHITQYEVTNFDIQEVNGDGDLLDIIGESLWQFQYKKALNEYGIGLKKVMETIPVPQLEGEDWLKMSTKEIQFYIASALVEDIGIIDVVEYEGTIHASTDITISGTITGS